MPLKSPQFAVSNGENKEMSASDTKNLSREELAKKVLSLSQEVLSLSQEVLSL
eukprot:CAMPEP_0171909110 /NCGR_PEP_ID=MMETSP0993-20121228/8512_1 /TAXON_ID=483369 /ORGANISM="non described non described, Strain CCMP2098" /LENGTH=52 /DNA_ID=CAMNT_0012542009 /DNA_START=82 /DNA_END=237 /DNA_ORIENTATION=+